MKNDAIVQGSLSRCTLATCGLFIRDKLGIPLRSKSELVRAVFMIVEELARNNGCEIVNSIERATRVMHEIGAGSLNPQNRLRKNLMENLQQEALDAEGVSYGRVKVRKHTEQHVDMQDVDMALEMYRKSMNNTLRQREQELSEMQEELGKDPRK